MPKKAEKKPIFDWTDQRTEAAQLVASGELSFGEIAEKLGMGERTLYKWRTFPEFEERVDSLIEEVRQSLRRRAISAVERRVDRLNRDWLRLQKVIEARAACPDLRTAPGGDTGLLCKTVKGVGTGADFTLVNEYAVDTGLLKELRDIEKQAASELGQWMTKTEVTAEVKPRLTIPEADDRPRQRDTG